MENIKTDLRFEDQGHGLTRFVQKFDFDKPLEVEADGFEEGESERVNELASTVLTWVRSNEDGMFIIEIATDR
ncbi:MAG: hypothetical protein LBH73_07920 [Spirochaetaceae bacterium]|jgi:hypothetical protein|nr:hypothetical protein [Spirochaetaceae bacterium]